MLLKKGIQWYRRARIRKLYQKKATIIDGVVLLQGAYCENDGAKGNIVIEPHCTIGAGLVSRLGGKIHVGKNTYIGPNSSIQSKQSIQIGDNVIIANNVLLIDNNNHPVEPDKRLEMSACDDFMTDEKWSWKDAVSAPICVGDNVWIGRDSRILKGVTIGRGSVVALGAIVTKDVPPYSIVAGNPAQVVKTLKPMESENCGA